MINQYKKYWALKPSISYWTRTSFVCKHDHRENSITIIFLTTSKNFYHIALCKHDEPLQENVKLFDLLTSEARGPRLLLLITSLMTYSLLEMLIPIPCGLVARISGFHPGGPGSIPGVGTLYLHDRLMADQRKKINLYCASGGICWTLLAYWRLVLGILTNYSAVVDYLIFIKTEICTKPLILCSLIP